MAYERLPIQIVFEGVEYPVLIRATMPILDLKFHIERDFRIPFGQQSLNFNGQWLRNDQLVRDYQMMEGAKVYIYKGVPINIVSENHHFEFETIVERNYSVQDLKVLIHSEKGIPFENMILRVGDSTMLDRCFLEAYDIVAGSVIYVE